MIKAKRAAVAAAAVIMAASVCAFAAAGCSSSSDSGSVEAITKAVSRESGSGTRDAFDELIKVDGTALKGQELSKVVSVANSTDAVGTAVAGSDNTIGYMSMGSVAKYTTVQSVKLEGVEATTANVTNGTYKLQRNFNIVYTEAMSQDDLVVNLVSYIESSAGQQIISDKGYVTIADLTVQDYTPYAGTKTKLTIGGSSSVTPLMQKIAEEYMKLNSGVTVTVTQSDSGTGITQAAEGGSYDVGMASRDLKSSETGVIAHKIAIDGISVVVKKGSWLENVTIEQLYNLYLNGTAIENS